MRRAKNNKACNKAEWKDYYVNFDLHSEVSSDFTKITGGNNGSLKEQKINSIFVPALLLCARMRLILSTRVIFLVFIFCLVTFVIREDP